MNYDKETAIGHHDLTVMLTILDIPNFHATFNTPMHFCIDAICQALEGKLDQMCLNQMN